MEVKEFIEKFIDYIDADNYSVTDGLYAHAWLNNVEPGDLTDELLAADIDPSKHIDYLPWRYLSYSDKTEFHIPEGIDTIGTEAFYGSSIERVYIPSTMQKFGESAFANSVLSDIFYPGTREEFYNIESYSNEGRTIKVHAQDGDFRYEI